jgi:hypothetical protein
MNKPMDIKTARAFRIFARTRDEAWAKIVRRLEKENSALRRALLNKRGDDLCWIEDPKKAKALPADEFLESCRRYHAQLLQERGELSVGQMTIAQLERLVARLKHELHAKR